MSLSRNWSSYKRSTKGQSSYARKTAEIRKNPPKAEVIRAYEGSLAQAKARRDEVEVAKLTAKLESLRG